MAKKLYSGGAAQPGSGSYTYDESGNLLTQTDLLGRTIAYAYDDLGRLKSETWVGGGYAVHYTYDALGRLKRVSDPNVAYTYGYDAKGRLDATTVSGLASSPVTVSRVFDAHDRLRDVSDSLGGATTYAYDPQGRLSGAQFFNGSPTAAVGAIGYRYDSLNRVDQIDRQVGSAKVRTALAYDPKGRVGDIVTSVVGGSAIAAGTFHYAYDAHNRLSEYAGPEGTKTYQYDGRGQLAKVLDDEDVALETYDYDAEGNRESAGSAAIGASVSYSPGVQNRILSDGTYSYEYDAEGNRTAKVHLVTTAREDYQWDFRNRLTRVIFKDSGGMVTGTYEYAYDAANHRIAKRELDAVGGTILDERYVYDGDTLLLVLDGAGAVKTRQFLVGGAVVAQQRDGEDLEWLLTDHQGSTRALVTGAGSVTAEFAFDSYGNLLAGSDDLGLVYSGWTGLVYDAETGNHYAWNRYYDPRLGEWLNNDPIGFAGGTSNLSEYVGNGPTNGVDPTGLMDSGGHFWMTYLVARSAGIDVQRAHELAYYTFYPDIVPLWNAVPNTRDLHVAMRYNDIADAINAIDANENLTLEPVRTEHHGLVIQVLHGLHGGNPLVRRDAIQRMLADGHWERRRADGTVQRLTLQPWQQGFLLHAFGDAFAHSYTNSEGQTVAFGWRVGHGLVGHYPDAIANFPDKARNYCVDLYGMLAPPDLQRDNWNRLAPLNGDIIRGGGAIAEIARTDPMRETTVPPLIRNPKDLQERFHDFWVRYPADHIQRVANRFEWTPAHENRILRDLARATDRGPLANLWEPERLIPDPRYYQPTQAEGDEFLRYMRAQIFRAEVRWGRQAAERLEQEMRQRGR